MASRNPNEPPAKPSVDIANVTGMYLYVIGFAALAWMFLAPILINSFRLDFSPLFNFYAGAKLRQRKNSWRWVVIFVYGFAWLLSIALVVYAFAFGTESMMINVGGALDGNPSLGKVVSVPVLLLSTNSAKSQFEVEQSES